MEKDAILTALRTLTRNVEEGEYSHDGTMDITDFLDEMELQFSQAGLDIITGEET